MDTVYLFKGILIGFVIAAPLGPIGILCARRTLTHGRRAGFFSGMGAATADVLYGFVAASGLTFVAHLLLDYQAWMRLGGGAVLCILGIRTFIEKTEGVDFSSILKKKRHYAGMYTATFFLTLSNPMTILSFAAVFAGFGIAGTRGNLQSAAVLSLGVFLGSVLWWLFLVGLFSLFKKRFKHQDLRWVNRIAGVIIGGSGVLAILSLL